MKLSQIDTAVYYPVEIPSTKKKTKFRPFVVKEEKALLMAQESEDPAVMLNTLEEVIRGCVQKCPDQLTTFDVEYLFLQVRAKSVSEESRILMKCKHCGTENQVAIDLTSAKLTQEVNLGKIKLNDKLYVQMKYPSISAVANLSSVPVDQQTEQALISAIDVVYYNDEMMRAAETDIKDIEGFILNRTDEELDKLIQFIENIPTVKLETEYECRQCANMNEVVIETLADFF